VEAILIILYYSKNKEYVIFTGRSISLLDFIKITYGKLDLSWEDHVFIDEKLTIDEIIDKLMENKIKEKNHIRYLISFNNLPQDF